LMSMPRMGHPFLTRIVIILSAFYCAGRSPVAYPQEGAPGGLLRRRTKVVSWRE